MSYTNLIYHIVFRPRSSAPVISRVHAEDLYRYIWGFVKEKRAVLYRIGGMEDHVHMLVQLPASLSLSSFMHDLKLSAGAFMRSNADKFPRFDGWGKSYFAATVSMSGKDAVTQYIMNQRDHHKRFDFREELLRLIRKNGIEMDERFFLAE